MSGCCALQCFILADNACLWLSLWVATVPCSLLTLLTILILGSSECEWLLCLQCFKLLTMPVLGSSESEWLLWLAVFQPANNACPFLFRRWVAAMPYSVSTLLTMLIFGSLGSEWMLCLAMFQACWQCLSLALQFVCGCCNLRCFNPANNVCSWFPSMWVAAMPCSASALLTMPFFLALQDVSGCCDLQCFNTPKNAYPWLFREWVAAVTCNVSTC